jgi:putative redox protein
MANATSPVELSVEWRGEQRIVGWAEGVEVTLDGAGRAGPTPVQTVAFGLASCMAIDVVHILTKGRFTVTGLAARLSGERAAEDPRRYLAFALHFTVRGDIPPDKIERALALSREKYCSVWHSLRQDMALVTTFEVSP